MYDKTRAPSSCSRHVFRTSRASDNHLVGCDDCTDGDVARFSHRCNARQALQRLDNLLHMSLKQFVGSTGLGGFREQLLEICHLERVRGERHIRHNTIRLCSQLWCRVDRQTTSHLSVRSLRLHHGREYRLCGATDVSLS